MRYKNLRMKFTEKKKNKSIHTRSVGTSLTHVNNRLGFIQSAVFPSSKYMFFTNSIKLNTKNTYLR